jgi:hypothetical protein
MYVKLLCLFSAIAALSSCYRMPTEEDYSLTPITNNREYTREKVQATPGLGY